MCADSLVVIDNTSQQFQVFSPNLRQSRTGAYEGVSTEHAERLRDGRFIVAADIRTPRSIALPLHVVSADGKLIRSFGSPDTAFNSNGIGTYSHVLRRVPDGTFWTASKDTPQLRHWDSQLMPIEQIEFGAGLPKSLTAKSSDARLSFLKAKTVDLFADGCERLWVISIVPAGTPRGDPGIVMVPRGDQLAMKILHTDRTVQTSIDVIDTRDGKYLASFSVPLLLTRVFANGKAVASATDDAGLWHSAVVQLHLALPPAAHVSATCSSARSVDRQ
jgi:hypothetical protein